MILNTIFVTLVLFSGLVRSAPSADSSGASYGPPPPVAHEKGMPYDFAYSVDDDLTQNHYAHSESSDGNVVSGEYRVLLPDGRTQIVRYRADHHSGFVADVSYEGEAIFAGPPPPGSGPSYLPPPPAPSPSPRPRPPPPPPPRPTPYPPVTPYPTSVAPLVDSYAAGTDQRTASILAPPQQAPQYELEEDEYAEYSH